MADRFYSVVLGEGLPNEVTEGAATSGEAIELRVSDTAYAQKIGVLNGLQAILGYLQVKEGNPIT